MPLVDVRGFDLGFNAGNILEQGQRTQNTRLQNELLSGRVQQQKDQTDRQAQIRELLGQAGQAQPQTEQEQMLGAQTAGMGGDQALSEQPKAIMSQDEIVSAARNIDPVQANKLIKEFGLDSELQREEMSRFAAELQNTPFEKRADMINARARSLQSQGRDASHTMQLLDLDEAQQNQGLTGIQMAALSTKDRLSLQAKQQKASLIKPNEVQSSKILAGGVVQMVMKNGDILTKEQSEVDSKIIKQAENRAADLQGLRARKRETGKGSIKRSLKLIDTSSKMRANNRNLRKAITLLDEGAKTGPVEKMLPNLRAASVKLQNLQSQLGLDVVGAVTFGALSKGELDLAKDVALPTGLKPLELKKWVNDKINAQEKLANYLEDQAIFLDGDGSPAGWLAKQKEEQKTEQSTEKPETQQVGRFKVRVK